MSFFTGVNRWQMVLNVQKWLKENNGNLVLLNELFGIKSTFSEDNKLVILNYDQIESKPKHHPIVIECRGLTLEKDSWKVITKSFNRFFNYGECPEITDNFNWKNFSTQTKEDGSLLRISYYNNWFLQTRGSFAKQEILSTIKDTWESLFFPLFKNLDKIPKNLSLIAEGCSRLTKVVRDYGSDPKVFLLSVFNNDTLEELSQEQVAEISNTIEVPIPKYFNFTCIEELKQYLENLTGDPTFEGFVVRDNLNNRLKIKNKSYLALSHLKGNNNILLPQYVLPIVLSGETEETLLFYPEYREWFEKVDNIVSILKSNLLLTWNESCAIVNQKDFALKVKDLPGCSILFNARKLNNFEEAWKNSESIILKEVERKLR